MAYRTVTEATMANSYGDTAKVVEARTGRMKGKFTVRGAGYAGRVFYSTVERAKASVEGRDVRFAGWVS